MTAPISIVTPSYAQGRFIERTIQSVLQQDVNGLEYVVMDGGSQDETVAILRKHESELTWVSEKDGGQTDAVNKGIRATSGEIIGWLNSDDVYLPFALERVLGYFTDHPEIDVLYGDANHIDENDEIIEPYYTEAWDPVRLTEVCYLCQPAVFFRRRVVDRYGPLDVKLQFCMDYEYWIRLSRGGANFAYLPTALAGSRMYAENKTLSGRLTLHREINSMLRHHLGRVPDRWLFNYAHAVVEESRERSQNLRFVLPLAAHAVYASLRWNHYITPNMARTLGQWIAAGLAPARPS